MDSNRGSEPITLLVIIGCEKDDGAIPFVIGAFNEEYLNQLPLEDAEEQVDKLKRIWTMEPAEYDWREARVRLDIEDLAEMFETPDIEATWA